MLLFADFDEDLIQSHVQEYQQAAGLNGAFAVNCIHKTNDPGREQMVFSLLHEDGSRLVLKKDFAAASRWIQREYELFEGLQPHFAKAGGLALAQPVYLGKCNSFHITNFAEGRRATDILRAPNAPAQANQVFRRAGKWLDHLHRLQPQEPQKIWMNWIFEELEKLLTAPGSYARPQNYRGWLGQLRREAEQFQASPATRVFCHGDFHSGNLILGKGTVCGLDLAYAKEKPGIYDVVDFLASDLTTPCPPAETGPGGIRRACVEFFFKTYRFPVSRPLLDFHLRARLLLELARIRTTWPEPKAQAKHQILCARITSAFAQPLGG